MTNVSVMALAAGVQAAGVCACFVVDWHEPLVPVEASIAEVTGVDMRQQDC